MNIAKSFYRMFRAKGKKIVGQLIFIGIFCLVFVTLFTGCGKKELTPEEAEAKRIEQYTKEEADTGLKRMDSPNITDFEKPLQMFIEGIQGNDPDKICEAVGSPAVLDKDDIYGWVLINGYDILRDTEISELRIRSRRENATATFILYEPNDNLKDSEAGMKFSAIFEGNKWILLPPNGVQKNFQFTAPVRDVTCGNISLGRYASSSDYNGNWMFDIPHMIITDNMNGFKMTSDLGQFNAIMYSPKNSYSTPELITDMDNSQRDEYLVVIEDNMEEVFKLMKEGADSNTLAKILVSETMINNCTPTREEDKTALREKLATYESTEITINSPTKDYPDAYSGRLYKENGVQMDVKIKINTNTGECRRTATVTMQKINNEWKIVNIVTNDSKNIFSDFNVFNPAW